MGYCPYMCIVCENIEDNGWGYNCKNFKSKSYQEFFLYNNDYLLNDVKTILNLNIDLSVLIYDTSTSSTPITFSVCPNCYRKYRYTKEYQNGICLKLYSRKKVNGNWIKIN